MRKVLFLLLSLLCSYISKSQMNYQSKVTDSATGNPVAYATVSVYKIANAAKPVQNIITAEDGSFKFTVKDTGSYKLIIIHTSYQEVTYTLNAPLPEKFLLTPKIKDMGNVIVTARKPLIEKNDDKIIYNVEADASLDGQMATDALRKTPFLSVDGDGNVQLKGQSNFKVLLNGKESAMFAKDPKEALKSFPASMIKKIEVITNPSSKYDAEGVAGIINIITVKKVTGYNGSIGVYYNTLNNMNLNSSVNIKHGKVGFAGYLGLGGNSHPPTGNSSSITEALQPVVYAKRSLLGESKNKYNWQYGNAELSWDIDSLNTVSAYGNVGGNDNNSFRQRNSQVIGAGFIDTTNSLFIDSSKYKYPWADVGVDYIRKFKKENQELTIKFNHQFSNDKSLSNSNQYYSAYNRFVINDNTSLNNETTIQSDLTLPLPKSRKLELGVKGILRNAASDYLSLYRFDETKAFTPDNANTDNFRYRQDVYSSYFTYAFKIKKWSLRLGGRIEHTDVKGDFKASNDVVEQCYNNFIPSVYLSRKLKEKHDVSISYSKRLRRPYIWNLNPFVSNTDSLNLSSGNPSLQPELTHSLEIGYSYFKNATNINIKLSENYCNNQIIQFIQFNNATGVSTSSPFNIGRNFFTGLSGNVSTKFFKIWSISANFGTQYNIVINTAKASQKNKGFSGYSNISNTIDINKKLMLSVNGNYYRSAIQLQGTNGGSGSYSAGFTYKMLDNKLRLTISASNFLAKYINYSSNFQDDNFYRYSNSQYVSRSVGLSLRWNFGKLTDNVSRKRGISNDDVKKN